MSKTHIKTAEDFFNKLAKAVREKYFPTVKYYRDDKNCAKASYTIELFNNGCLTYGKLVSELAKYCKDSNENIHALSSQYISSFGDYIYKP